MGSIESASEGAAWLWPAISDPNATELAPEFDLNGKKIEIELTDVRKRISLATPTQEVALLAAVAASAMRDYRESQATEYITAQTDLEEAKKDAAAFEKKLPNTMVMQEMATPRDTFIKVRGAYDHNGDKVTAGTPAFLPAIGAPAW